MKIQTTITANTSREFAVRRFTNASAGYAAGTAQKTEAVTADTSAVTLSSTSVLRPSGAVDIDIDKVAAIKAALRDGSYSIDSGSIADGMLGTARDLLQRGHILESRTFSASASSARANSEANISSL
ncbi:negative regulator of flagellin synthesis [Caballeronia fortuita]|uniref:Negative regulator of flagellin synthesis n=1 Tax=Caballeronia fortuita TaxID=1777138 RepID=A0A158CVU6_9BURK|nr:flagellar biosynthesis anti-sigma factor FlgM [Caballeronia fortuita]SAK86502.1 negative regulator of flagellin synthesis [Caballeronia fortuita]